MDDKGEWRPPQEWPEDDPPIPGWTRQDSGRWAAPVVVEPEPETRWNTRTVATATDPEPDRLPVLHPTASRIRQRSDERRGWLTVVGALGAAAGLLIAALVLISQAGAADEAETAAPPTVVFAAETEADLQAERIAAAANAPAVASARLDGLPAVVAEPSVAFEPATWVDSATGCQTTAERVLIAQSSTEVGFADGGECVVERGSWADRWLGSSITRASNAVVEPLVPVAIAHVSGGAEWDDDTRQRYVADLAHPASLHIVRAGSGHNPADLAPDGWKPARQSRWCAYAVDWVTIKHRWQLGVTDTERVALEDMLATCDADESLGADPSSVPVNVVASPEIGYVRR